METTTEVGILDMPIEIIVLILFGSRVLSGLDIIRFAFTCTDLYKKALGGLPGSEREFDMRKLQEFFLEGCIQLNEIVTKVGIREPGLPDIGDASYGECNVTIAPFPISESTPPDFMYHLHDEGFGYCHELSDPEHFWSAVSSTFEKIFFEHRWAYEGPAVWCLTCSCFIDELDWTFGGHWDDDYEEWTETSPWPRWFATFQVSLRTSYGRDLHLYKETDAVTHREVRIHPFCEDCQNRCQECKRLLVLCYCDES